MERLLKIVGQNVARGRKLKGWSQERLAAECGLHRTYIGGIERGERNISLKNVAKITDALEITPAELLSPHTDE